MLKITVEDTVFNNTYEKIIYEAELKHNGFDEMFDIYMSEIIDDIKSTRNKNNMESGNDNKTI